MVKRKRVPLGKARARRKAAAEEEAEGADVESDVESAAEREAGGPRSEEEDAFFETADEKRVRLAKEYLGRLGEERAPEQVQEQLARDREEQERRTKVQVEDLVLGEPRFLKGHKGTATCVCLSSDESTLYSGGKDCAVLRWDVETGKKDVFAGGKNRFECGGHFDRVMSVCLVEERQLLLSAGIDRVVRLWDPRTPPKTPCIEKLMGHTGYISALAADPDGMQAYSASMDKSLKVWDLRTRKVRDTLFGHVAGISCMDLYYKGRPLTGSVDKTARLWKLDKDTHLMFSRHTYAVDAVAVLDFDRFVSGSQDGSLLLWSHTSKKPLAAASVGSGCWVTALGAIRRGNVAFSGSVDGKLHTWRFPRNGDEDKSLQWTPVGAPVQAPGCINAIAVGRRLIACAVGKEHKFGRWFYNSRQRDGVMLVPMSYRES